MILKDWVVRSCLAGSHDDVTATEMNNEVCASVVYGFLHTLWGFRFGTGMVAYNELAHPWQTRCLAVPRCGSRPRSSRIRKKLMLSNTFSLFHAVWILRFFMPSNSSIGSFCLLVFYISVFNILPASELSGRHSRSSCSCTQQVWENLRCRFTRTRVSGGEMFWFDVHLGAHVHNDFFFACYIRSALG